MFSAAASAAKPPAFSAAASAAKPPVAMMVFDEFSLGILMTADGHVDRGRFPNFAGLADRSTWYRRHTTLADVEATENSQSNLTIMGSAIVYH